MRGTSSIRVRLVVAEADKEVHRRSSREVSRFHFNRKPIQAGRIVGHVTIAESLDIGQENVQPRIIGLRSTGKDLGMAQMSRLRIRRSSPESKPLTTRNARESLISQSGGMEGTTVHCSTPEVKSPSLGHSCFQAESGWLHLGRISSLPIVPGSLYSAIQSCNFAVTACHTQSDWPSPMPCKR